MFKQMRSKKEKRILKLFHIICGCKMYITNLNYKYKFDLFHKLL